MAGLAVEVKMVSGGLWTQELSGKVSSQLLVPKTVFSSPIHLALPTHKSFPFYRKYLEAKKALTSQGSEILRVAVRYAYAAW